MRLTPPYELLLAVVPEGSADELVAELHARELHAREVSVPGVHGEAGVVERFAAAWIAGTSLQAVTTLCLPTWAAFAKPRSADDSAPGRWSTWVVMVWRDPS